MYDNLTRTNLEFAYQKAEKRIEELERKLEQTEKDLADYQFNYPTIKELEKENAELKTNYKVLSCSVGDWEELQEKYEKEQRENNGLSDQLAQAKELIREWLRLHNSNTKKTIIKKSERFLKEIEK